MIMRNILLIGNGFDLAHGLPTSYNDFLFLMKNWTLFYALFNSVRQGKRINESSEYYKYLISAENINEKNIKILDNIINHNSWVEYYCRCEAEVDGWIDFEREIFPVIRLFEKIFSQTKYEITENLVSGTMLHMDKAEFDAIDIHIAELWNEYFIVDSDIVLLEPYASKQYGILKKRILKSLRDSFDEFIRAFEIYLYEFVYRNRDIQKLKQIVEINADYAISFNYTLTEKLYGIEEENVHHIHGMIRENLSYGKNNMVIGVNEQINQNMDFIYFVKYFQRIQKASGVKYKKIINSYIAMNLGRAIKSIYDLHIYGHSLDETDKDILEYIIGKRREDGKLYLNPSHVIIYYYDATDYEQKVINLIKLYGRPLVEEYLESGAFRFVKTSSEIWSEP